jgi:transposase
LVDCYDAIQTAKLNGINPMAYLADVLERIVSGRTKQNELHTLLPWNWIASTSATITDHAA